MTKRLLLLLLAGWVSKGVASLPPGFQNELRTIKAVNSEGRGNIEASASWKKLAAGPMEQLLPLLEGMEGANDFALNWIRAAIETIASRELNTGGKLPISELGKFLLDTRHHPRARRLAFELLARVEPTASNQLLAGMLNDPSLEIRHDAVQMVIEQADQALRTDKKPGATLLFQQALVSARDVKQIDDIAKKLEGLGQLVDLPKLFGFVTHWKTLGPFDNTGRRGFDKAYPPEQKIDSAGDYEGKSGKVQWRDYVSAQKYGQVDMNQQYGKLKDVLAYARTDFISERAQTVELRFGGKNSWKIWLNGEFLFGRDEYHFDSEIDQYLIPAQLKAGPNTILVKVCQNEQTEDWTVEWEFQLRVTDALGTPIVSTGTMDTKMAKDNPATHP